MLDTGPYFDKLVRREPFTEDEIVALLKAYKTAQAGLAYMASCQAATYESLPESISKSRRERHAHICQIGVGLLKGDASAVRYPTTHEYALQRCQAVINQYERRSECPKL